MGGVEGEDIVIELASVPAPDSGAPLPVVMADEDTAVVAYFARGRVGASGRTASVRFTGCLAIAFGPPNDEAFEGHPLASRGLKPYAAFRIEASSWIRRLCRMNEVHDAHAPGLFEGYQHVVIAFHDSTLEVVCRDFDARVGESWTVERMHELLRPRVP